MKKNNITNSEIDFAVGGQAVIEGVMMRSPNAITIAVRKPDGKIVVQKRRYISVVKRIKWLNIPIIRGVINLVEMMVVGAKAINYSASISMEDGTSEVTEKTNSMKVIEIVMFIFSFVLAMGLALFLFKFLPLWITTKLQLGNSYIEKNYIVFNLIDGLIKISFFVLYIWILSVIPSFRRVFEYHGAEHKSIFTYESHKTLNVENAKPQPRFHPRCGTSFILIVFVISILVYTFVPKQEDFWINFSVRIAFLPLIAGIAYEVLKISAKHTKNIFVRAMIAPGLWLQRITTKEPDSRQLEVGLTALKEALNMEK